MSFIKKSAMVLSAVFLVLALGNAFGAEAGQKQYTYFASIFFDKGEMSLNSLVLMEGYSLNENDEPDAQYYYVIYSENGDELHSAKFHVPEFTAYDWADENGNPAGYMEPFSGDIVLSVPDLDRKGSIAIFDLNGNEILRFGIKENLRICGNDTCEEGEKGICFEDCKEEAIDCNAKDNVCYANCETPDPDCAEFGLKQGTAAGTEQPKEMDFSAIVLFVILGVLAVIALYFFGRKRKVKAA